MCSYCKVNETELVCGKEIKNYFGKNLLNSSLVIFTNSVYSVNTEMGIMGTSLDPYLYFEVLGGLYKETIAEKSIPINYCPICGRKLKEP